MTIKEDDPRVESILTAMMESHQFRMFGGEVKNTHLTNPVARAMEGDDASFALGVDVRSVIRFVLNRADEYEAE